MEEQHERIKKFHAHLDVCERCEHHPFDLCPTGARLLKEAAVGPDVICGIDDQAVQLIDLGEVRRINDELRRLGIPLRIWYRLNRWADRVERRHERLRKGANVSQVS